MSARGLYLHVPFCAARCSYCAFATWTDRDEQVTPYFEALAREASLRCEGLVFDTVYFGGGTPSRPDPRHLQRTLAAINSVASLAPGAEVSLEVNPESCDAARADLWLAAGFNRASVGVQSFDPGVLATAGRLHGPAEAERAVHVLRQAGFSSVSLDLIVGLPGESAELLRETRQRALALAPDHLSLYLLELDEAGKASPLAAAVRAGRAVTASDDDMADRYEESCADFEAAGLAQYEISNFARPGQACRHSLKYWRCERTEAAGVAAHWLDGEGRRRHDVAGFEAWLRAVGESGDGEDPESRSAAPVDLAAERVILGLRLTEGVDLAALERASAGAGERFATTLERHAEAGLLLCSDAPAASAHWRLTARGRLLSNEVFADLLAA